MKTNNLDNYSDNRVVDILSPRFAPSTNLEFKVTAPAPRRRFIWQFARVGGIAAVVAIALFVGVKGVQTSTAREFDLPQMLPQTRVHRNSMILISMALRCRAPSRFAKRAQRSKWLSNGRISLVLWNSIMAKAINATKMDN